MNSSMNNQPNQTRFDNPNIPGIPVENHSGQAPNHRGQPQAQVQFYTPSFEQPPVKSNNTALLSICGGALLISAGGLIWNMTREPQSAAAATTPAPANTSGAENIFAAQARMMNQAMDMAKQAREMQKEHQDRMERAMREMEEGPSDDGHLRFPSERR